MYIPLAKIIKEYNIIPTGVIHCGGHWGEEYGEYKSIGVKKMIWIEPCKPAFDILKKNINDANCILINVACGAEETELPMNISRQNQGQSNSFLISKLHSVQHPDILFTETEVMKIVTLDSLPIDKGQYNILVTDCEGYDGEVMKGAKETLKHIDLVYSEVNKDMTREGNMLIGEFEELLWEEGFVKIEEYWPSPNFTWGDAVFIRKSFIHA